MRMSRRPLTAAITTQTVLFVNPVTYGGREASTAPRGAELGRDDRQRARHAVAGDAKGGGTADRVLPEQALERSHVGDRGAVERHDHVAGPQPRPGGRAALLDGRHLDALCGR